MAQRLFEKPLERTVEHKDFVSFLKCMEIVFNKRKQLSVDIINAFVKRLALVQMHLPQAQQAALLLLIKQIMNRYSSARSAMLDFEDDSVSGGFSTTPAVALYRGDLNDPQMANASQSQIAFELCHTYEYWCGPTIPAVKRNCVNLRLARSILCSEGLPNDCLSVQPVQLFEKL